MIVINFYPSFHVSRLTFHVILSHGRLKANRRIFIPQEARSKSPQIKLGEVYAWHQQNFTVTLHRCPDNNVCEVCDLKEKLSPSA